MKFVKLTLPYMRFLSLLDEFRVKKESTFAAAVGKLMKLTKGASINHMDS